PGTFEGEAVAGTERVTLAGRDQIERLALRLVALQWPPHEHPPQIAGERWAGAHGVNARLGRGVTVGRGGGAGGKHVRVRDRLQRLGHPDEALVIERE